MGKKYRNLRVDDKTYKHLKSLQRQAKADLGQEPSLGELVRAAASSKDENELTSQLRSNNVEKESKSLSEIFMNL